MNRNRLDAESIRDAVLQITGKLDLTMGGPAVMQFKFEDPTPGLTPTVDYAAYDVDSPEATGAAFIAISFAVCRIHL